MKFSLRIIIWFLILVAYGFMTLPGKFYRIDHKTDSYFINNQIIDITVKRNAITEISEEIEYVFNDKHIKYGYKKIPLDSLDKIYDVSLIADNDKFIENQNVREWIKSSRKGKLSENKEKVFATWKDKKYYWIGWFFAADKGQYCTINLSYKVRGAMHDESRHATLKFPVIPKKHDLNIKNCKISIYVPRMENGQKRINPLIRKGKGVKYSQDALGNIFFHETSFNQKEYLNLNIFFPASEIEGVYYQGKNIPFDYNSLILIIIAIVYTLFEIYAAAKTGDWSILKPQREKNIFFGDDI